MGKGIGEGWFKFETLLLGTRSTVQQRLLFFKQTSLKEPSWMSLYKGLQGYLVFLESLEVVYVDLLRDQRIGLEASLT